MPFDHALRRQEGLDLLSQLGDAVVLPHPIRPLRSKPETLQTKADAGLAGAMLVRLLVALLSANSAGVAARLCSDGAFWLRRSGFLLRLLGAGVCRGGGDGLAGALGDVGHGDGRGRGRGVLGRRDGQMLVVEVDRRRDEMRGERRWRRRLRYMYSGRLFNRARAVCCFCQRLRGVHTRRLNFGSGPRRRSALIYLPSIRPSPRRALIGVQRNRGVPSSGDVGES